MKYLKFEDIAEKYRYVEHYDSILFSAYCLCEIDKPDHDKANHKIKKHNAMNNMLLDNHIDIDYIDEANYMVSLITYNNNYFENSTTSYYAEIIYRTAEVKVGHVYLIYNYCQWYREKQ